MICLRLKRFETVTLDFIANRKKQIDDYFKRVIKTQQAATENTIPRYAYKIIM